MRKPLPLSHLRPALVAVTLSLLAWLQGAGFATLQSAGPSPHLDSVDFAPVIVARPGDPFEVTVRATNRGADAPGGSITVSYAGDAALTILQDDTSAKGDLSYMTQPHERPIVDYEKWLRSPPGAKQPETTLDPVHPVAEVWYSAWRAGVTHVFQVRISPRTTALPMRVYIRIAMRTTSDPNSRELRLDPAAGPDVDQQHFPAYRLDVRLAPSPTPPPPPRVPTNPPAVPPTLVSSAVPTTRGPGSDRSPGLPTPGGGLALPNLSLPFGALPTVFMLAVLGGLAIVTGMAIVWLVRPKPAPQPTPAPAGAGYPPPPPPPVTASPLAPGTVLRQRYEIVGPLGSGGMANVFLSRDRHVPGKNWAIKAMVDTGLSTADLQDAKLTFEQEAEILARLSHSNLPQVADFFSEGGHSYLVMEYIDGQTLESILAHWPGPMPENYALGLVRQLCDVLEYLHSRPEPVIFRDLKPSNIMLQRDGRVKLIDFGIARLFKPGQTRDTRAFGTPGYAAPEQYGQDQSDARADIYALGVILLELVTRFDPGQSPFSFPPARTLNPALSPRVEQVIQKATQFKPAQRYQSVTEMRQALGL